MLDDQIDPPVVHGTVTGYTIVPWWITASGISGNAHKLYAVLMHFADNQSLIAWPSRATLAEAMGFNRPQTLDKYLDELAEIGALEVVRRKVNGVNLVNQYKMNRDVRGSTQSGTTTPQVPQEGSTQSGTTSTQKRIEVVPKSAHELEPKNYNQRESASRATPIPAIFPVTNKMQTWAREAHPRVNAANETDKFINYHTAKGTKFRNWESAWRNWIIKADEYQQQRQPAMATRGAYNMATPMDPYAGLDDNERGW